MSEDTQGLNIATKTEEEGESPGVADTAEALLLEEMTKAGVLYGRKKSKTHPRMKKYIFATRNGFEVFDLPKTTDALESAKKFLAEIIRDRGTVILVGTAPAAKGLIQAVAKKTNFPLVTERWLGGTLTNFKTLSKRIDHFKQLKADKASGKLDKYTKKERVLIDKKIEKMTRLFGGLEKLERTPNALFVIDAVKHDIAVREALRLNIPIVAIVNSDTNPEKLDYVIPANTNSKASLTWIMDQLGPAFMTAPKREITKEKISEENGSDGDSPKSEKKEDKKK
jgi:small subunit ribosomal protein S2